MPASIILSKLSWSTPDERALLSNLDLAFGLQRAALVGRNGTGKTTLLKLISGELRPHAGTVTVNGTLGILRQSVQVDPGETVADLFGIAEALALLRKAESGVSTTHEISDADWTLEDPDSAPLPPLGLDALPETRLADNQGGQCTLAHPSARFISEPAFLLLDQSTNNLT